MVLLRAVSALILLTLTSCWSPVFNQDLSVAELVRGKLTQERDFTVALNNGGNNTDLLQAGVSYDSPSPAVSAPTYVILSSNHNQVQVQWSSSTGINNSVQLDVPLSTAAQASIQPDMGDVNWYIPTLVHQSTTVGGAGDVRDVTTGNGSNPISAAFQGFDGGADDIIGFCTAQYEGGNVAAYFLAKTSVGLSSLVELYKPFGSGVGSVYVTTTPPTPDLNPLFSGVVYSGSTGWMAVDLAGGSNGVVVYLSHAPDSSGEYVTDMLDKTGLLASWKGHDHVAGFLSTERLLTREGSFYNVCDTKGSVLYSFPGGTLQFAGEYYDTNTGTFKVRFSEALLQAAQNGGQNKVRVRIYSIATSKLDSLQ